MGDVPAVCKGVTMEHISNYINGELVAAISGQTLDNIEPATGLCYAKLPDSGTTDIDAAVSAAAQAFNDWAGYSSEARASLLYKIADLIIDHQEALALAESIDSGKPVTVARQVDIPRASANFRFFSSAIQHFASESHSMGKEAINYTLREPIGVVGCISPWNLPLYLFSWKIAPALAAGNTVVAKPSELTPVTAYMLSKICMEAGLPAGVLNIVHGSGASVGQPLVEHQKVSAISFTGGTKTGAQIAKTAGPLFKKVSLELGGKNPTLIFADCHYEQALTNCLRAAFFNQGEVCLAGSRVFIEKTVYQQFKDDFINRVRDLNVSDPLTDDCTQGAVISQQHLEKILAYVKQAEEEGGKILSGGKRVQLSGRCNKGYFIAPTIIEGLSPYSRINQEEVFGPVVTLTPFDTEEQVLEYANSTAYGLSASIWSNDIGRCHALARQIQSGLVWINCWMVRDLRTPFGGIKQSGVGREGGVEALKFFTEAKNVCVYTGERG